MPEYQSSEDTLYYDRAGEGETPVIFIHGFLASSRMWRDYGYVDSLPSGFSAYIPDMRGHGRSNAIKCGCDLNHMYALSLGKKIGQFHPNFNTGWRSSFRMSEKSYIQMRGTVLWLKILLRS